MADEEAQKQRSHEAEALLSHPLMLEAFRAIRDECVREFSESEIADEDARTRARHKLEGLKQVTVALYRHVETGKLLREGEENDEQMEAFLHQFGL